MRSGPTPMMPGDPGVGPGFNGVQHAHIVTMSGTSDTRALSSQNTHSLQEPYHLKATR